LKKCEREKNQIKKTEQNGETEREREREAVQKMNGVV
jgi:hypothetical protein